MQKRLSYGGEGAPARPLEPVDEKYHQLLLAANISHKENEHLRQELAAARTMAVDEKMVADRLRSQVNLLQGKR